MKSTATGAVTMFLLAALPLAAAQEPIDLAVTRVALFSSGVGYFECDAEVTGNATAELKFRTDQINDIIKSMVVQDPQGKIGVIGYASQDPIEKALRSFGVDLTGDPTLGQLLDQLRGEPVEVIGPREMKGTIVGVEESKITDPEGNVLRTVQRLTLLTDAGLQQVELTELRGIKLLNDKVEQELQKALATLATGHDADKKTVLVNFEGDKRRPIRVSYLLEAPIWKTSYRLVLRKDKKPFMQGWATVENATEEDWNNVSLALVSGRPISFRMDLYTPLYVPRPLEQLELYASLRPPEYAGGFAGEPAAPAEKRPALARARRAAGREAAPARGQVLRSMADMEQGVARERMELEGAGVESVALAAEAGELFQYTIDTPVSIPRQHSAMLPIITHEVDAAKVSIYNPDTHRKHPLNGLELTNTTGLNLMQGPVTVFDDNLYAGDAMLPDMKPDEKRLVAYALDLGTEVLIDRKPVPDELVSLRIVKGTLWTRYKYQDKRVYNIKNKSDRDREVIIEQPYSAEWKLVEPDKPYERTQQLLRFKVPVPAMETVAYTVVLEHVADQSVALSSVGLDRIDFFLNTPVITPELEQALKKVVQLRMEIDEATRQREQLEQKREEDYREQERIRENLKTLDKDTDAYRRQLENFDAVDTRITGYNDAIDKARQLEAQKRAALEEYLVNLTVG